VRNAHTLVSPAGRRLGRPRERNDGKERKARGAARSEREGNGVARLLGIGFGNGSGKVESGAFCRWLAGRQVGWLVGRSVGRLIEWLIDWLADWLLGRLDRD